MVEVEQIEEEKEETKRMLDGAATAATNADHRGSEDYNEEHDSDGFETASEGVSDGEEEGEHQRVSGSESFAAGKDEFAPRGIIDGAEKISLREGEEGGTREEAAAGGNPKSEEQDPEEQQNGIDEANRLKAEGNALFATGNYEEALATYHKGLVACPLKDPEDTAIREIRAVLHSNRAACFSYRQMHKDAVDECSKALELNPNYVKALMRRAHAREKLENYDDAIVDLKKLLELDAANTQARVSLRTLVPLADAKREKLKAEMMAKLKEAGNSILGHFGMSVDNFKTVQDPNTGGYSIQFQR